MTTITIEFSAETDRNVFVELLAQAIRQAIEEPLQGLVETVRSSTSTEYAAAPANSPNAGPELLDINATAKVLSISASTVNRLVDGGRMPKPIALGRIVRWSRVTLDEWIPQDRVGVSRELARVA